MKSEGGNEGGIWFDSIRDDFVGRYSGGSKVGIAEYQTRMNGGIFDVVQVGFEVFSKGRVSLMFRPRDW